MADQRLHKAGEKFVMPVTFQVLKIMGHEDRIFHLCSPMDDSKQVICLKDPFFIICTEKFPADEMPDIPAEVIQRAADFINLGDADTEFQEEDGGGEETDE